MKNFNITILAAIAVLILIISYLSLDSTGKNKLPSTDIGNQEPMTVVVEETKLINNKLPLPAGFPTDIPVENSMIIESVTTSYPSQDAQQLSVSYFSTKTVSQKYTEYKNYMTKTGYQIKEGDVNSPVRAIFGTKTDTDLTVVVSRDGKMTLVQISYLLKSL